MANYTNAQSALNSAISSDLVEEYEVGNGKRRVKRGSVKSQLAAAAMLDGLVARRAAGSPFRLAKLQEPND